MCIFQVFGDDTKNNVVTFQQILVLENYITGIIPIIENEKGGSEFHQIIYELIKELKNFKGLKSWYQLSSTKRKHPACL